jgi:hypothetical protein
MVKKRRRITERQRSSRGGTTIKKRILERENGKGKLSERRNEQGIGAKTREL